MPAADLVEHIYEAAQDPKGWAGCIIELEAALGGVVALSLRHPTPGDPGVLVAPSLDPDFVRSYQERYFALDPLRLLAGSAPVGRLAIAPKVQTERELRETRFFKEWLDPQELHPVPSLAGVVSRDETLGTSLLAVLRAQGARRPSPAARRLGSRLMPHMRRALRIHFRILKVDQEARSLASAVDRVPIGLILVDARRHVRATNRAAERILAGRDGLALDREGLRVVGDAEQTEHLRELIGAATALQHGESPIPPEVLQLQRTSGRRPLQLLVTPIGRAHGSEPAPVAAVYVCESDRDLPERPELLRRLFDLTPAEAALARKLASGCPLEQSAQDLGIAIGTARQRLQQVFAKTQTKRQSDLVRLLLTGPSQLLVED